MTYLSDLNYKIRKILARSKHLAGQIINLDDNGVEISFLKHSEKYFWWPDPLNDSWVDINDIHLKLDTPNMDRRQHLIAMIILKKWIIVVFRNPTIVYYIFFIPFTFLRSRITAKGLRTV